MTNFTTVIEFADLCNDSYIQRDIKEALSDGLKLWTMITDSLIILKKEETPKHFFARAYRRFSGDVVIAYRGTASLIKDAKADLLLFGKWQSSYVDAALKFYDTIFDLSKDNSLYQHPPAVTGHSLGGYLAQVVSDVGTGSPLCVAFNAPQASELKVKTKEGTHFIDYRIEHPNIHNIDDFSDLIHHYGKTLGDEEVMNMLDPFCKLHPHDILNNPFFNLTEMDPQKNFFHFKPEFFGYFRTHSMDHEAPYHITHGIEPLRKSISKKSEFQSKVYPYIRPTPTKEETGLFHNILKKIREL